MFFECKHRCYYRTIKEFTLMSQSINVLMRKLYDPNPEVRGKSAMDLGENMAVEAISSLTKVMLNDEDAGVRSICAEALGTIADPSTLPDLVLALEKDMNEKVQFSVDWAIKAISRKLGKTREEAIEEYSNVRTGLIDRSAKITTKATAKSTTKTSIAPEKRPTIKKDLGECIAKKCNISAEVIIEYEIEDGFIIDLPLCKKHSQLLE